MRRANHNFIHINVAISSTLKQVVEEMVASFITV